MKIRLAKKIITSQCRYWEDRRVDYEWSLLLDIRSKKDHRVRKANIVTKRRYAKTANKKKQSLVPCFFRIYIGISLQDSCGLRLSFRCSSPGVYHEAPW